MGVNIVIAVLGGVPLMQQYKKRMENPHNINGLVF